LALRSIWFSIRRAASSLRARCAVPQSTPRRSPLRLRSTFGDTSRARSTVGPGPLSAAPSTRDECCTAGRRRGRRAQRRPTSVKDGRRLPLASGWARRLWFESPRTHEGRCYPGRPRAPLAQLAEQRTLNPQVLGSSPRGGTHEGPGQSADQGLLGSRPRCTDDDPGLLRCVTPRRPLRHRPDRTESGRRNCGHGRDPLRPPTLGRGPRITRGYTRSRTVLGLPLILRAPVRPAVSKAASEV
jgi:hypothetical protein